MLNAEETAACACAISNANYPIDQKRLDWLIYITDAIYSRRFQPGGRDAR